MKSPGAPSHRREVERDFWAASAKGLLLEEAALVVGASQAVGARWFRHGSGMPRRPQLHHQPDHQGRSPVRRQELLAARQRQRPRHHHPGVRLNLGHSPRRQRILSPPAATTGGLRLRTGPERHRYSTGADWGRRRRDAGARPDRGRGVDPAAVRPCRGAQRRLDPRPGQVWLLARSRAEGRRRQHPT